MYVSRAIVKLNTLNLPNFEYSYILAFNLALHCKALFEVISNSSATYVRDTESNPEIQEFPYIKIDEAHAPEILMLFKN